jgi:outer membrane protein
MNKINIMNKLTKFILVGLLALSSQVGYGQEIKKLTLDEVIKIAEEQSPNAMIAMHTFRASYWQYRTFVAEYRPSLTLTGTTPSYSRAYERFGDPATGQYRYVETNTMTNLGSLALSQNIGLTGGSVNVKSDLTLQNDFSSAASNPRQFITTPISVGLVQPIFRYNSLYWQKKTEPLKYETAKKTYVSAIENVHLSAVQNFFGLALAQINKQIADRNYKNADTLYRMAQGRYNLGTIAEGDVLDMQLSFLNAGTALHEAEMNLTDREIRLRSFLGYNETVRLELIIPDQIPNLELKASEVLDLAMANNPDIMNQQLKLLTAESNVAQAKAERGLNANLTASFGLNQRSTDFATAYDNPNQTQRVNIGFTMPILDWGLGRGKFRMAQSSQELTQVQVEQALIDFQQNLMLDVDQFNLQKSMVATAALSDTVAQKMYEVTKQRFLIGKIEVLVLNNADTKKDQNRRAYVQSLQNYWNYFYNIRSLTLYDFVNNKPIETDFEKLLQ